MSSKADAVSTTKASAPKASSSAAGGRPSLKNLTRTRVPRAGIIGCTIGVVSAVAWQLLVTKRHENDISAFYKSYDPERDYARMKSAGVFKTLEGRERPEWLSEYEGELDAAIASLRSSAKS